MYSNQRTTEMAAPTKRGSPQGYYAAGKRATNRVGKNEVFKPKKTESTTANEFFKCYYILYLKKTEKLICCTVLINI